MKLFTLSRESLFNLVLTWSFFLLILLPFISNGQQLKIKIISVSSNINNAGKDNFTWHVKWRKDGNASYGSNDKCYTVSNNGPIVYSINEIYTSNYVLNNTNFGSSNFQLTIEGWEENKGNNCSYNGSSPIPDRDYAIKTTSISNFGIPYTWNPVRSITATNQHSPQAVYTLVFQIKYEPVLLQPAVDVKPDPACINTSTVTVEPKIASSYSPNLYSIDWQYQVPGDVTTTTIPNPAYCGPCGGGGDPLDPPFQQQAQALALPPGGGGGGAQPCCDEPPFITTTTPVWRTLANGKYGIYTIPSNILTNIAGHYSGSGAFTVKIRYRVKYGSQPKSAYSTSLGSFQLNPPPPVLPIAKVNPNCKRESSGEIHLFENGTDTTSLKVQWVKAGSTPQETYVSSLNKVMKTITIKRFPPFPPITKIVVDYYIIENLAAGDYTVEFFYASGANSCRSDEYDITLTDPTYNNLTATLLETHATSLTNTDGTISLTSIAGGKTAPSRIFSIASSGSWDGVSKFTGLTGDNFYTVTIAEECESLEFTNIFIGPKKIVGATTQTKVKCSGESNGELKIDVSGYSEIGKLQYKITGADTKMSTDKIILTHTFTGLVAGNYQAWARDKGYGSSVTWQKIGTQKVTQPGLLVLTEKTASHIDVNCSGESTGQLEVQSTGGNGSNTYLIDPKIGNQPGPIFSNLPQGNYTITVTDNNNCSATKSVIITEPQPLGASISSNKSSCFGDNNGMISIGSIINGNGANVNISLLKYDGASYEWRGTMTIASNQNFTFSNLTPGNYKVELVNSGESLDCNKFTSSVISISEPAKIVFNSVIATNEVCFGANDGTITPWMKGGEAGFTFFINKSNTGWVSYVATAKLTSGTYELKAKYGDCEQIYTQPITIDAPTQGLDFTWESDDFNGIYDLQCATATTTITVNPTGGWGNYQYKKDNGSYTSDFKFINLQANTDYEFWIKDDKGCEFKKIINLSAPASITATFDITPIDCFGESTGRVDITASGGLGNYEYKLNRGNGSSLPNFENLSAGDYSILIDDGTCSSSFAINIPQNNLLVIDFTVFHIDCYGADNGSISTSIAGGIAPYTLVWNTSETTSNLTDLAPGMYVLNITDAKGCTLAKQTEIVQPTAPLSLDITATNATCKGANNGTLLLHAAGGTAPYDYSIDNGITFTSTVNWANLSPTIYQINIRDNNGCINSQEVIITEPPLLEIALTLKEDVLCNGETGTINVAGSGGTMPYYFAIDGGNFDSNAGAFENVLAGMHTIDIKDSNDCTETINVELTEPDLPLEATFTTDKVSCKFGENGAISTVINGGTAPYAISWDGRPETTTEITNLIAGDYTIYITDANGCSLNQTLQVEEPVIGLSSTSELTHVSCNSLKDGTISIKAIGGYGNYQYSLNGATFSAVSSYTNLAADNYQVRVKDAGGCIYAEEFEITEPDVFAGNLSVNNNVSCFLGTNGAVSFIAYGGTSPYSYSLNSGSYQSNYYFDNLSAGTYYVIAEDANGCRIISSSVYISQPTKINATTSNVLDASCNQFNGKAKVNASGGVPPYTYQWENNTNDVISTEKYPANLKAGLYTITITDSNNCEFTITQVINDEDGPTASIDSFVDATCFGGTNGRASVLATGGAGNYTYNWSNGESGIEANQLTVGTHFVEVVDQRGCSFTAEVSIGSPEPIKIQIIASIQPLCFDSCEGETTVLATGGVAPYTYNWPQEVTSNGPTATSLCAGTYQLQIIDANGCAFEQAIVVDAPEPLSISFTTINDPTCNGFSDGDLAITVEGGAGNYQYVWNNLPNATTSSIANLTAATYQVMVTDNNGCVLETQTELTEPEPLTISLGEDKIICANQEATLDAVLADGSYEWLKDGGKISENQQIETTGTGTYKLNLVNSIGCSATDDIYINQISNSLDAAFLSATEIAVGDSLQLVDVSWEMPDDLVWDYGIEVNIIDDDLWSPIIQYDETGTYEIKLTAYLNGCVDSLTKIITLIEASEESKSGRIAEIKGIKEISVFPNPTDGKFSIHIELYAKEELAMSVYDITGGIIERQVFDENIVFRNDFNLSGKKQGIYLVQILTPSEERMIRIFIK